MIDQVNLQKVLNNNSLDDIFMKILYQVAPNIHWRIAPKYYTIVETREINEYNSHIDPFELRYINPNEIKYLTRRKVPFYDERWHLSGKVMDSVWDIRDKFEFDDDYDRKEWFQTVFPTIRYEDSPFHKSLVAHFKSGKSWEDTEWFTTVTKQVLKGNQVWHSCQNVDDIIERCYYIDDLYKDIKKNGYKTQFQLGNDFKGAVENELMVDIGREGELLFVDGRHRLSIAKILRLDAIPVQVGVRHRQFVEKIDLLSQTA